MRPVPRAGVPRGEPGPRLGRAARRPQEHVHGVPIPSVHHVPFPAIQQDSVSTIIY